MFKIFKKRISQINMLESKYFSNKRNNQQNKKVNINKKIKCNNQIINDSIVIHDNLEIKFNNHTYKVSYLPKHFQQQWDKICEMRKEFDAPVDTMGCSKCHDLNDPDLKNQRFQSLVSLMLSSQTKDEVNFATMNRLKKNNLSIDSIIKINESDLANLIKPVSFHNTKAKNIKKVCEILKNKYNSDIPNTINKLCELPGIGPKMGHLIMKCAWNEITGIAVDTHVHRISNRLKWSNTKSPEETMKHLEKWLPKDMWYEINELLVGFGQTICSAKNPKCKNCLLNDTCEYYKELF